MDGSAIGWLQFMSSHFCFALILISTPFANRLAAEVLDGRVVEDGSGSPVASARLHVLRAGSPDLSVDLETAADGRFHSPDLPAGGYRIEASKSSYISTTVLLRLPAASLTIRLVRCGAITGQVTDSQGRVPRGASVFPMVKQPGGTFLRPLSPTPLDDRGRYRLYNLSPGQYAAAVSFVSLATSLSSASGMLLYPNNARPEFFTISGGEEYRGVDFVLPPGPLYRISGTVELPAAGTRFSVAVVSTDQPALAVSVQATEPDGSFRVEGIPPGSYDLLATGPVSARSARGVVLGPAPLFGRTHVEVSGQDLEGISLRVAEGQSVRFVLRAAGPAHAASPCPANAVLSLSPVEDWGAMVQRSVDISSEKEQAVERLPPGRYHLAVTKLGANCYSAGNPVLDVEAARDSAPVEVLVAPARSIRGRLEAGPRGPSGFVVVLVASGSWEVAQRVQIAYPDAQSRFAFSKLRPGQYRIAARPAAEASRTRWIADLARMVEIEVPGGAPTEIELPAPLEKQESTMSR